MFKPKTQDKSWGASNGHRQGKITVARIKERGV